MSAFSLDAIKHFVNTKVEEDFLPQNTAFSIPLVTQKGNRLFYVTFLYDDSPVNNTISRPFAWATVPTDKEKPFEFSFNFCNLVDFISTEAFPLGSSVPTNISSAASTKFTRDLYRQELKILVPEILDFAFNIDLTELQKDKVARFKNLFLQTAYEGLYPFYNAIAPDFLSWIELTLLEENIEVEEKKQFKEITHIDKIIPEINKINLQLLNLDTIKKNLECLVSNHNYNIEKEIILVIDHINKTIDNFPNLETNNLKPELQHIKAVKQDLIDLLYRHEVEPFKVVGKAIDVSKQKIIETEQTLDQNLDKTLSRRISVGWAKGNIIIRPELIKAFLFE